MKRISKIIKKDNFMPELGYIVVTGKGMSVYNGQNGILYSRKIAGERLCSLADEKGPYGIPDPAKFLKIVSALEKISSVELIDSESALTIKFAGKGIIKIPVVTNLHDQVPHLILGWQDFTEAKKVGIPISSLWKEISELITNEGEALWGDVIGVYGNAKHLVSFDYGVYLHSDEIPSMTENNFYCPRSLIDLGLKNIEFAVVDNDKDTMYLVGQDVQYVCTGVAKSEAVKDMVKLKDDFAKGKAKKVTLDFTSGLWKRAKLFASAILSFKVVDGQIFVEHDTWSEVIGKTEAPDAQFTTRISLLERWASGTFEHGLSITEDGTWNLYGKTRGGMSFYAVLTDVASAEISNTEEVVEDTSDEIDIEEGNSLL